MFVFNYSNGFNQSKIGLCKSVEVMLLLWDSKQNHEQSN